MRLGLLGSLLVHAGAIGAACFLAAARTDARGAVPGAYLDMAPRPVPESRVPPPPEPVAPAEAPEEILAALPDEAPDEPVDLAEAELPAPMPFRLRPATKLATPLPVRRAIPAPAPAPAPRKPAPSRTPKRGELVAPRLLEAPAARYPARARRLGWEGRVLLELRVSERGVVDQVAIAVSSGHALLDRAAVEAARGWTFRPATRDGRPVAHTVRVPVDFTLVSSARR